MEFKKEPCLNLIELSKNFRIGFKRKLAVNNVSLSLAAGEIVALLGPNGSGKSTTFKMILGFLKPTHGVIELNGEILTTKKRKRLIGYAPENPTFPKFLNSTEILYIIGQLLTIPKTELKNRIEEILFIVGLLDVKKEKIATFSKGMVQRLALAQALISFPSLLILDEPMSGLDIQGQEDIRNLLLKIHENYPNSTVFFSTHSLEDAARLSSSVVFIKKGEVLQHVKKEELFNEASKSFEICFYKNNKSEKEIVTGINAFLNKITEFKKLDYTIMDIRTHLLRIEDLMLPFKEEQK